MLSKWVRHLFWQPFERFCRRLPLVPLRAAITEVQPGVRLIRIDNLVTRAISRLGGGYDYSVIYLLDGTLLIDTGFPWARRCLRAVLRELGADRTITQVVNTHCHEDHTGNNDTLIELCGAKAYAHPLAVPEIRYPPDLPWYRNFMFGPVAASEVHPIPERVSTANFSLEVLHTPGHSPDHVCLYEPTRRWLFGGDLYVAADLDSQLQDVDGPAWIASLDRVIALGATLLLDAHGVVVSGEAEVADVLRRKRDFLADLERRISLAAGEAHSVREITQSVFPKRQVADALSFSDGWLSLLTCSDFSRSNLVRSFLRATRDAPPGEGG